MKSLQNNTLKNGWPMTAPFTNNDYLCPEITKEMNDETLLNDEQFRELEEEGTMLKPYTREELLEMAETGRKQIAEGKCFTTEEVLQDCGYIIPKSKAV